MAWNPQGINLINKDTQGSALVAILLSLSKELARLQQEIDELKRSKS
jgi:hypothetical protein